MSTMLNVNCLVVSKPQGEWNVLLQHYSKLLRGRIRLTQFFLSPEKFKNTSQRATVLAREADRLQAAVPTDSILIVCTERGRHYTSIDFVKNLLNWSNSEQRALTFVLGGPLGLAEAFEQTADQRLALSTFTLPHDLAYLVLLEQMYRASTIISGKTYHY